MNSPPPSRDYVTTRLLDPPRCRQAYALKTTWQALAMGCTQSLHHYALRSPANLINGMIRS